MADQQQRQTPQDESEQETFKREGPQPAQNDTGRNVDEMNRAAEESVIRNVTPDEQTD